MATQFAKIPTYIINLKRNPDRRDNLMAQIDNLNLGDILDIVWFDAIDGKKLETKAITLEELCCGVNTTWYEPTHMKPMTCGEVGCGMSHWRIWESIIKNNYDCALILEDDIVINKEFSQNIHSYISAMSPTTDLAYVFRKALNLLSEVDLNDKWKIARTSYWTCAYILTNSGAQKLLSTSYNMSLTPVDEFLSMMFDEAYRANIEKRCKLHYEFPTKFMALGINASPNLIELNSSFSFNTSNTYHSPSICNLQTNLIAITFNDSKLHSGGLKRWIESCESYGIPYHVIQTFDNNPQDPLKILSKNSEFMNKDSSIFSSYDYVIYTNNIYSFFLGNPNEIMERYRVGINRDESKILAVCEGTETRLNSGFIVRKDVLIDQIDNISKNIVVPDTGCVLFQHLYMYGPQNRPFRTDRAIFSNNKTGSTPKVLCGCDTTKIYLNSLSNYTLYGLRQQYGYKPRGINTDASLPKIDVFCFFVDGYRRDFIKMLENIDYPSDLLRVFVFDNFNRGANILDDRFDVTYFDCSYAEVGPHIMRYTLKSDSEYVWLLHEGYNITNKNTLKSCIDVNKDVVAPLLKRRLTLFSNFWGDIDENGFYKRSSDYLDILNQKVMSLWDVPYVHGNILLKKEVLIRNPDMFISHPKIDRDMAICKTLRDNNELIYLLNTEEFGYIEDEINKNSLVNLTSVPNHPIWTMEEYLHPLFYDFMFGGKSFNDPRGPDNNSIFNQIGQDIWQFPLFTEDFCDGLVSEANKYGEWSPGNDNTIDPRLSGGHENYPTQDIHLTQLGLGNFWKDIIVGMCFQRVMSYLYKYKTKGYNISFIARYKFGEQIKLAPHHDASNYTTNIALNTQDVDYVGGGSKFLFLNTSITHNKKGYVSLHPGKISHYHEGMSISSGTRYILVSFNE